MNTAKKRAPAKAAAPRQLTTAEKVQAAKRPQATEKLVLRGDLVTAYNEADEKLRQVLGTPATSLAGWDEDEIRAIAQQLEDLRLEMEQYTIVVLFEALPQGEWNRLKAAHPPRVNDAGGVHEEDRGYGINITSFFPAALTACTKEPSDLTPEMWADLLDDKLSDGQIQSACTSVWLLNRGVVSVPFSPAVSKILHSGK